MEENSPVLTPLPKSTEPHPESTLAERLRSKLNLRYAPAVEQESQSSHAAAVAAAAATAATAAAAECAAKFSEAKSQLEEEHAKRLEEAELAFERRLGIMDDRLTLRAQEEEAKAAALERQLRNEREERERQETEQTAAHAAGMEAAVQKMQRQVTEAMERQAAAEQLLYKSNEAWEARFRALEAEADADVEDAKSQEGSTIAGEWAAAQALRGEAAFLKQALENARRAAESAAAEASRCAREAAQLRAEAAGLQQDLAAESEELASRNATLMEKKAGLRALTTQNTKLEANFAELEAAQATAKREKAAAAADIAELTLKERAARAACRAAAEAQAAAELAVSGGKTREAAARKEILGLVETAQRLQQRLRQVATDIEAAAALIHRPAELKAAVVRMHQLYVSSKAPLEGNNSPLESADAAAVREPQPKGNDDEVARLKTAVARLQRQVVVQREAVAAEKRRAAVENGKLVEEIIFLLEVQKR